MLRCLPETSQPDSFNEDEHQCQNILHSFLSSNPLSAALPCSLRLSPSSHLDVSPALLLSELLCGVYTLAGLCALVTASLHVCMRACGCVSVSVCMCRMKCHLLPRLRTHRHNCTHGGGGCCVRTEGTVGVLSELDLVFLYFTLHRAGVME